jgi:hypothetical protein
MKRVVPRWESMRYDGTNGDEVCQFLTPPAELVSEANGVLVYSVQGWEQPVKQGDYVLRESTENPWGMVLSAEEYERRYVELPE